MNQPDTEVDLDQMHSAICTAIREALPILQTVEAYDEDRRDLPLPACLIELVDLEPVPDDDPGTEQLAATSRWEARIILGLRDFETKRAAPKMAAAIALAVRNNRWGLRVGPAVPTAIEPDDFAPELDKFEVWRIDWEQRIHIGPSVWTDEGTIPTQVFSGFAPEVGAANPGDYGPVTDE
ncbi:hypothetical protein [Fuscibacter oryzae]|uniref:Phage protein n=1 Tax=Fuscibacter oryzae TaxID=2803939 RepID=A0A8J7MVK6_9RHOB|nr:hypothetical protein [Fuscibacter oryzae]MBL4929333.1 hypothetical protein [Fuscibacter oryzae]